MSHRKLPVLRPLVTTSSFHLPYTRSDDTEAALAQVATQFDNVTCATSTVWWTSPPQTFQGMSVLQVSPIIPKHLLILRVGASRTTLAYRLYRKRGLQQVPITDCDLFVEVECRSEWCLCRAWMYLFKLAMDAMSFRQAHRHWFTHKASLLLPWATQKLCRWVKECACACQSPQTLEICRCGRCSVYILCWGPKDSPFLWTISHNQRELRLRFDPLVFVPRRPTNPSCRQPITLRLLRQYAALNVSVSQILLL